MPISTPVSPTLPDGRYHIEDDLDTIAPHHKSFKALWETKWEQPCEMGVYPFMFGSVKDFQPVVDDLVRQDMKEPYDWSAYAQTFFPKAVELVTTAETAEKEGNREKAEEYYLRASALYRIARFPIERSPHQKAAWTRGKAACLKGLSLRSPPVTEVSIPHIAHQSNDIGTSIPVYYALPTGTTANKPVPLLVILSGLDGHRTELAVWMQGFLDRGIATMVMEIPGTGDHPGDPKDPTSPDRVFDSVFAWIGAQQEINKQEIAVWGFSTGGYYATRVAHTHGKKLKGVVSLGGGTHWMFDEKWLNDIDKREYPFPAARAISYKFGYGDDVETFKKEARKFSLVVDGTLDTPGCTKLLMVNGAEDGIFPIEDTYLPLEHGDRKNKESRVIPDRKHMGEPESFFVVFKWLYDLWGMDSGQEVMVEQLKKLPFKTKY